MVLNRAGREGRDAGGEVQDIQCGEGENTVALRSYQDHLRRVGQTVKELCEDLEKVIVASIISLLLYCGCI